MTHDTPPKRIWAYEGPSGNTLAWPFYIAGASEYILTSEADAMVAAALREAARTGDRFIIPSLTPIMQISEMQLGRDAAAQEMQQRILALIPVPASAALDRAILEAKTEVAAILGVTTARDTMTGEPVMWGDEDGDCLTPEIAVQCALDKLIAEAVMTERERSISIAASLAAAISLLERGGKAAKKAAPSDKMFDQMLVDYRTSLEAWRAAKGDPT